MQKWLFTQFGCITSCHVAYFPAHFPYIMTCRLLFPTLLLPTMTLAIICRNGSEPFKRILLTVLTACLYHPSSSILHSLYFPPFSFISLLPPSFSTIHLSLFAFILHSPSFLLIHLHSNSWCTFVHLHSHSAFYVIDFQFISLHRLPDLLSSSPISLLPLSFTFTYPISLHSPSTPLVFIHSHHSFAFFHLPPTSTTI